MTPFKKFLNHKKKKKTMQIFLEGTRSRTEKCYKFTQREDVTRKKVYKDKRNQQMLF